MTASTDIRLIIFDWDGTLFNSIQSIVDSLQVTADKFAYRISEQQAKDVIGLALPKALNQLFPTQDIDLQQQILQTYIDHNIPHSSQDQWYEGAWQMLSELKQAGFLLAVATGKARQGLERVLQRTQSHHLFATTRCADEAESKPNPLMLQQILNELALQPHQAIMVGDSCYDLQMAQNIAMPSVGVDYGVHDAATLQHFQPLTIARNIPQLSQFLLSQSSTR